MKMLYQKFRKMVIILLYVIIITYLLGVVVLRFIDINDVTEVYPSVHHFEAVFRSKRYWADGRFDIYEFSLEEEPPLDGFEPMDGFGQYVYRDTIKGWIIGYYNEGSLSYDVASNYEKVMKQPDVQYRYISRGMELQRDEKYFIYSRQLNRGYVVAK